MNLIETKEDGVFFTALTTMGGFGKSNQTKPSLKLTAKYLFPGITFL